MPEDTCVGQIVILFPANVLLRQLSLFYFYFFSVPHTKTYFVQVLCPLISMLQYYTLYFFFIASVGKISRVPFSFVVLSAHQLFLQLLFSRPFFFLSIIQCSHFRLLTIAF